ncbi:MAG: polysaccharide pyruvyl transferase family protein [Myxococcota bacterium]|nr:polysaccharide pyruvyl transferase family protein [Myxococcota bacterium]
MRSPAAARGVGVLGPTGRRVGLFGAYHSENFGDDLMAVMFGRRLQELGVPFTVFGLGPEYASRYGFAVAGAARELVAASDVVVCGGGGLLQPRSGGNVFDRELEALLAECRDREVPILGISLGGAGLPLAGLRPRARRELLERCAYATLRLRCELPLLAEAGTPGAHHEDVVWATPHFFPPEKEQARERTTIAFSLYGVRNPERRLLTAFLRVLARARRDCDLVLLEARFGREGRSALRSFRPEVLRGQPNVRFHQLEDLESGLRFLQGLDLLFTSRLHVAIAAMSYGVPCVSLLPRPKTALGFRELGLGALSWTRPHLWRLARLLRPGASERLVRQCRRLDPAPLRRDAELHLRDLEQQLRVLGVLEDSPT